LTFYNSDFEVDYTTRNILIIQWVRAEFALIKRMRLSLM